MLLTETPKKIWLIASDGQRYEECAGTGVIKPGHLVARNTSTAVDGVVAVHPVAGGPAEMRFALENGLIGKTIADSYASGDRVLQGIGKKGDVFYAFLSGGETVTPASYLSSNGDGTFKVASGSDVVLARSLETVNATDSNDVDERVKIIVL